MKNLVRHLLFLLIVGCQNTNTLDTEQITINGDICPNCPNIDISIPHIKNKTVVAKTINTAVKEEIISLLIYDDEIEIIDLKDALTSFKNGFLELRKLYTDETTIWEAAIDAQVTFEDAQFVTIALNSYIYTGGAHGYTSQRYLNFDKLKGIELENWQLLKNEEDFTVFAESTFREKHQIPVDKSINYTGFMFDNNLYYLPENIGFTKDGMVLLYNPYEVASYSDGNIELIIPYEIAKKYLLKNKED